MDIKPKRYFVAWFNYNFNINCGLSICLKQPNIEIHIPLGFFKIGWEKGHLTTKETSRKKGGFGYRYGRIISNVKPIFRVATLI